MQSEAKELITALARSEATLSSLSISSSEIYSNVGNKFDISLPKTAMCEGSLR